jgi:hypothetical protein
MADVPVTRKLADLGYDYGAIVTLIVAMAATFHVNVAPEQVEQVLAGILAVVTLVAKWWSNQQDKKGVAPAVPLPPSPDTAPLALRP